MEIIEELEEVRRGLYGGATGYVDFSGDMDFCITIRTMIKKGREVYLQAGAGIVVDRAGKRISGMLQQSDGACKNTSGGGNTYDSFD